MMQMPLQRLLFDKGNGNGSSQGWAPTQNEMQDMLAQVSNAYFVREGILSKWMDPRRDYDKECGYPETTQITAEIFRRIYERDPIGRRVIRFLPEECWQKPPEVYEDDDPNVLTEFERAWQDLSRSMRTPSGQTWYADQEGSAIWEALIRLDVLSRIGQYGVMLLGFDDGQDLSLPVRGVEEEGSVPVLQEFTADGKPEMIQNERGLKVPKLAWPRGTWEQAGCPGYNLTINAEGATTGEGKKASLKYLRVFPEDLAQVVQWEVNQSSPRYGHPAMYMINQSDPYVGVSGVGQNMSTLRVHWTRVLHVADNRDSSDTNGAPACRPVYNRLLDLTKLYGGSAEMYWAGAFPGISAETHPQLGGDVAIDKTEFRAQMKSWYNSLQRWLGMSGMSFKMLSPTVVDPKSQIDVQLQAICILLGVPLRIFMGSERGELASNMDDTTWTDRVRFRLHSHLTPHLIVPFIDRLIWLKVLPEPKQKRKGEDKDAKPGYYVTWPDLKVLSPQQKATVAQLITQCLSTYVQSGLMDLIEPLTYLTKVVGWDEKEARAYIEATLEEMKARNPDVPEEDLHVGVPPQPPMDQFGMEGGFGPEGGGFPPKGPGAEAEEPVTQEAVDNAGANCGIGSGGFKTGNKCAKGGGVSQEHIRTLRRLIGRGGGEALVAIDSDGVEIERAKGRGRYGVEWSRELEERIRDPRESITIVHNHPSSPGHEGGGPLSVNDVSAIAHYPGLRTHTAVADEGSVYSVSPGRSVKSLTKRRRIDLGPGNYSGSGEPLLYFDLLARAYSDAPGLDGSERRWLQGHLYASALQRIGAVEYSARLSPSRKKTLSKVSDFEDRVRGVASGKFGRRGRPTGNVFCPTGEGGGFGGPESGPEAPEDGGGFNWETEEPEEEEPTTQEAVDNTSCGTGAGGFQPGNTCARGDNEVPAARKGTKGHVDKMIKAILEGQGGKLSPEQTAALKKYSSSSHFSNMNQVLRSGKYPPNVGGKSRKEYDREIKLAREATRQSLPEGTYLYRGLGMSSLEGYDVEYGEALLRMRPGEVYEAAGLMSTSVSSRKAAEFAWDPGASHRTGIVLEIKARTGVLLPESFHRGEREVLQDHGTTYRVLGVDRDVQIGAGSKVHLVRLEEVEPRKRPKKGRKDRVKNESSVSYSLLYDTKVDVVLRRVDNAFCRTGEGGGRNNSCSPKKRIRGGGLAESPLSGSEARDLTQKWMRRADRKMEQGDDEDPPEVYIASALYQYVNLSPGDKKDWGFSFIKGERGLVAAGSLHRTSRGEATIEHIGSKVKGGGRAVVASLEAKAAEMGVKKIMAVTVEPGFFKKLGYVEMSEGHVEKTLTRGKKVTTNQEPTTQEAVDNAWRATGKSGGMGGNLIDERVSPAVDDLLQRLTGNAFCPGKGPKDNSCGKGKSGTKVKQLEAKAIKASKATDPYPTLAWSPFKAGKPKPKLSAKDCEKGGQLHKAAAVAFRKAATALIHRSGADSLTSEEVGKVRDFEGQADTHSTIAREYARELRKLTVNAFCKTGKGGGRDPTCGKGKKGAKKPAKRHAKLQDVKRASKDYALLSDAKKQQVLNRDIEFYTSVEMYRSVKTPGYKRLDPEKQQANREIGVLQGKARAYLDRAEAFDGSDRRMMQHIALGYFEQAQKLYDTIMKPSKRRTSR